MWSLHIQKTLIRKAMRAIAIVGMTTVALLPMRAYSYESRVSFRTDKASSDDGIRREFRNVSLDQLAGGQLVSWSDGADKSFAVIIKAGRVRLISTSKTRPSGMNDVVEFDMPDSLYEESESRNFGRTYSIRVFVTEDFTWIEMKPEFAPLSEARSVVFFVGPEYSIMTNLFRRSDPSVKFFEYAEFKRDVTERYADPYDPLVNSKWLEIPSRGWAAAIPILIR